MKLSDLFGSSRSRWRQPIGLAFPILILAVGTVLLLVLLVGSFRSLWPQPIFEVVHSTEEHFHLSRPALAHPNMHGTVHWAQQIRAMAPGDPDFQILRVNRPHLAETELVQWRRDTLHLTPAHGVERIELQDGRILYGHPQPEPLLWVDVEGQSFRLQPEEIAIRFPTNDLHFFQRLGIALDRARVMLTEMGTGAASRAGIAGSIVGTASLTLLMTILVAPLGLLAALYLHEYAPRNRWTAVIRAGITNLAGVPSIIFGVFGLGIFVYGLGSQIDQYFYGDVGGPHFGTGGLLWAALVLAILTLPTMIVATESALEAVPRGLRSASLACGATRWQTIQQVVLPSAAPGLVTAWMLTAARGAGEVAPLLILGAVRAAPQLPIDRTFPYLHLERKFTHLGFDLYRFGSIPHADPDLPLFLALVLVGMIASLLILALVIRHRFERSRHGENP